MTCSALKTPAKATLHQVQSTAKRSVSVAAEGEQRLPAGMQTVVLRWKKSESALKDNCTCSNVVAKFCEIFKCPSLK
jgi:hypothetical protein